MKKEHFIMLNSKPKWYNTIISVFPKAITQLCIVHQIRNSLKYVVSKDQKVFLKDLKKVYPAVNKEITEDELLSLYHLYFEFTAPIRKMIYTTNAVEEFHRQVRKATKTKGAFTNDMVLLKLVYLATKNI